MATELSHPSKVSSNVTKNRGMSAIFGEGMQRFHVISEIEKGAVSITYNPRKRALICD